MFGLDRTMNLTPARIETSGFVTVLRKFKGMTYARIRTPMANEIVIWERWNEKRFKQFEASKETNQSINIKIKWQQKEKSK